MASFSHQHPRARRPSIRGRRRASFTLIELLAAMAVLVLIVLLMEQLFGDAARAWRTGTRDVEVNNNARAALELMGREISGAVIDELLSFSASNSLKVFVCTNSEIDFVSLTQPSSNKTKNVYRTAMQVRYYITTFAKDTAYQYQKRYRLMRAATEETNKTSYQCYNTTNWFREGAWTNVAGNAELIGNISCFQVRVYDQGGVYRNPYSSLSNGPPLWVDVYLEVLGEDEALRVAALGGTTAEAREYAKRHAKRFTRRFFLHNQSGYGDGK